MVAVGSYEKSNKKSEVYENGNWRSVPDYPTAGAREVITEEVPLLTDYFEEDKIIG